MTQQRGFVAKLQLRSTQLPPTLESTVVTATRSNKHKHIFGNYILMNVTNLGPNGE